MSIATLIEDAEIRGQRDADGWTVIFDGMSGRNLLRYRRTPEGRWKAECRDGSYGVSVSNASERTEAVTRALNRYLDHVNGVPEVEPVRVVSRRVA